ncbi:GatB/YqeY domain-containing protein [Phaeovulum vinaykumarii]|uniref:Yqey-like protein n=1 Tax=Phaeovulum vinaykumarii TaxID=407234 RepID=A0A1N7L620_9RHOB|nr:GatB/YqeY domain-containing protein [Phaeovulum vinaykumarii]SIS69243.1 Yqey-like protein [Phaeovulum vinaykumarii]SOB99584.1 YqeY-like protein [Phaeovulum vinaykumarii]
MRPRFRKLSHLLELPVTLLRVLAGVLVVLHVLIANFMVVQYRWVFALTAVILGLLLAREMYQDMAARFFRLKSDELEEDRRAPGRIRRPRLTRLRQARIAAPVTPARRMPDAPPTVSTRSDAMTSDAAWAPSPPPPKPAGAMPRAGRYGPGTGARPGTGAPAEPAQDPAPLPPLGPDEVDAAIEAAIAEVGPESVRDMGRVMQELRRSYAGRMDFAAALPEVQRRLL